MILIIGKNGQVGSALARLAGEKAVVLDRNELDLSKPAKIPDILDKYQPDGIFNAAAYTMVDKAESELRLAQKINAVAPGVIATWCAANDVPLVHFSTDYVFDGSGDKAHTEDDPTKPVNAYGVTKLAGEKEIEAAACKHLIFRASWVYDENGKNFLNTMLRLGRELPELTVVNDQHGAPTYAGDLAAGALKALEYACEQKEFPSGVYHLCNGGETTWHGFAEAIFKKANKLGEKLAIKKVVPIPTSDYPTPAKRPHNSRLSCEKASRVLNVSLPTWQEGLNTCMTHKYASQTDTAPKSQAG